MSYVEKHLMPGEQIEYRANLHWLVFLLPILLFIPAVWLFSIGGNIAKAALQNKKPTKFETNFISFRQTAGLPPIMSLHRYWIYSNRMREYFEVALTKARQNFTNVAKETDPVKVTLAATNFAIGPGIFMSYWYGSLYVVIEGWRQLRLTDPKIDPLLLSPNVRFLKKYRDGVFHFQRNYFDDRFLGFIKAGDSVEWVRTIHSELGEYFRREIPQLDPTAVQTPKVESRD